ncbi:protein spinster homolog 1-like isoform X2 [Pristis pectinata]|uniref:protein spinster homolog 1-like isoform X2 n=1 Tax=Pristis pectinata TaxID=685728 RepID=UPI00223D22DE|nr:protein spinster homolog 1-like isoform X2 [Pristis pectinata]
MADVDEYSHLGSEQGRDQSHISPARAKLTVGILLVINLLNYMDRSVIAGILEKVQEYFDVNDSLAGLFQTVLICSFMILAPLFGYLGDRYNRKMLMAIGIAIWCSATLAGSFVTQSGFWWLILCLAFVGVGQASFSTIAPTIIADLFVDVQRTWALSIFNIAIPVGSGLGYILGSTMLKLTKDWHWGLRVTPCIGVLAILLLVFLTPNPPRGAAENHSESWNPRTSWVQDLKYLMTNWSFMLSSFAVAAVAFVSGVMALWGPTYLLRANNVDTTHSSQSQANTKDSIIFGVIVCSSGIFAIVIGAVVSKTLRAKNPQADPLICAAGLLLSAPFLYLLIVLADQNIVATFIFIFVSELFIGLNWTIVSDILLYVVIPPCRSMAEAIQITISHVFGDACSPYIIGVISTVLQEGRPSSTYREFMSLQYALLICPFIIVIGAALFFCTANHLEEDQENTAKYIQGSSTVTK